MWPGGRICSNCALARKRSAQSASTAWIFAGGDGKLEDNSPALELGGELLRERGESVMSHVQGVLYCFGTTRTRHLLCSMSKSELALRHKEGLVSVFARSDYVYRLASISGGGSRRHYAF